TLDGTSWKQKTPPFQTCKGWGSQISEPCQTLLPSRNPQAVLAKRPFFQTARTVPSGIGKWRDSSRRFLFPPIPKDFQTGSCIPSIRLTVAKSWEKDRFQRQHPTKKW